MAERNRRRNAHPHRINERIRISPVRLIDHEGEQVGIISTDEARERAQAADLDLVEVAPKARPPVCRIMDYGRYLYEQQKKAKSSKKRQATVEVKQVVFRPATEDHDFETKLRHIHRFLEEGKSVKIQIRHRGREVTHPQISREVLDRIVEAVGDAATVTSRMDRIEGRQMLMMLEPT